jgi:hypothetical protein
MQKDKNIKLFFRNLDPLGLIEDGFPEDEYDLSATELLWWFERNSDETSKVIAEKAYRIMVDRMLEQKSRKLRRALLKHALDIHRALEIDKIMPVDSSSEMLLKYLQYFDPSLVANSDMDLYDQVVSQSLKTHEQDHFFTAQEIDEALSKVYGTGWCINKNTSKEGMLTVICEQLNSLQNTDLGLWLAGSNHHVWHTDTLCQFIYWTADDTFKGKSNYIDEAYDQTIEFVFNEPLKLELSTIHLGTGLGVMIDDFGRVVCPTHFVDNLFLNKRNLASIEVPTFDKGRVYISAPHPVAVIEALYIAVDALEEITFDSTKRIVQFGTAQSDTNIEVSDGFVIGFSNQRPVVAWVKLKAK